MTTRTTTNPPRPLRKRTAAADTETPTLTVVPDEVMTKEKALAIYDRAVAAAGEDAAAEIKAKESQDMTKTTAPRKRASRKPATGSTPVKGVGPAKGDTGRTRQAPERKGTTRIHKAPAKAAAPKGKAGEVGEVGTGTAEGYINRWPHAGYDLFAKPKGETSSRAKWMVRCNAHGTWTPASSAGSGDALGSASGRKTWCAPCKAAK
jgi:hypothetical protein